MSWVGSLTVAYSFENRCKLANGRSLIDGKTVTGFANLEEQLIRLTKAVPYLLEDELKKQGATYKRGLLPFIPHVEVSDRLITGQNPQSAKAVAKALVNSLRIQWPGV
jgi:putative intracellular protease/amidase